MQATLSHQPLNAIQLHLLKLFSYKKTEESLQELKSALLDFYQKKLDEETDKWWQENNMTTEKFEEMFSNIHRRTPYTTR
jgi:hypothetical protein